MRCQALVPICLLLSVSARSGAQESAAIDFETARFERRLSAKRTAGVIVIDGRLDEAETPLRRALEIRRDRLEELERRASPGPSLLRTAHTDVATSLTNLAAVLKRKGRYAEARSLYRAALGIFRGVLDPEHYRVAVCLNNLALLLMETGDDDEAEALARKIAKGKFDLDDLGQQLRQMQKMGGLSEMMNLLPGMSKAQQDKLKKARLDDGMIQRQLAILSSMTPLERRRPEFVKARRKQRIAGGSGTTVQEVNKLLKQHQEAARMMKRVSKMGKKGLMRGGLAGMMSPGGGFPR